MSGRKHHYLPQLIQRPFAYRQRGKENYVHVYHKTRGRFSPNTDGIGKELDFYGTPDDTTLDDAITHGESDLAKTVQSINSGDLVAAIDMATLISAIAFRTKALRDAFVALMPPLTEALEGQLTDVNRLRREFIGSLTEPKSRMKLIKDALRDAPAMPREQRAKAIAAILPQWKNYVADREQELLAQAQQIVLLLMTKMRERAEDIAQGAYLKSLSNDPAMPIRAQRLVDDLEFSVITAPEGEYFVLGDCGPVARFTDGKARLLLGSVSNEAVIEALFLPVSPRHCITARLPTSNWSPRVAEINQLSASLSNEFFISDQAQNADLDALQTLIGTVDPIDSNEDLVRQFVKLDG